MSYLEKENENSTLIFRARNSTESERLSVETLRQLYVISCSCFTINVCSKYYANTKLIKSMISKMCEEHRLISQKLCLAAAGILGPFFQI